MKLVDSVMRRRVKALCGSDLLIAIFDDTDNRSLGDRTQEISHQEPLNSPDCVSCASAALTTVVESRLDANFGEHLRCFDYWSGHPPMVRLNRCVETKLATVSREGR